MPKPVTPFDGIAWVTGACSGVGYATAKKLAEKGWRVAATGHDLEKLDILRLETLDAYGKIIPFPGDINDAGSAQEIVNLLERDHGGVCLAVLNADLHEPVYGNQLDVKTFNRIFNANLQGIVNTLVPLQQAMAQRARGQIAIVSALTGYRGLPMAAAFGASKAATISMAESLKFDFDKTGILLQLINLGPVGLPTFHVGPFTVPSSIISEKTAQAVIKGLDTKQFEISIPTRPARLMKIIHSLPYWAYFPLLNTLTKWKTPVPEKNEITSSSIMPASRKRW